MGNANSIASKEANLDGLYSRKQLILKIVKSPGILENYEIMNSGCGITDNNHKLVIFLAEQILSEYFSTKALQESPRYRFKLKGLLEGIIGPWHAKSSGTEKEFEIENFTSTIPHILMRG